MKKFFLMAAMVLSSLGAFAQYSAGDITIQPKVGLSIADFTDIKESKTRAGVVAGVELEYHISPLLGLSGGLLYSMQGTKLDFNDENSGGITTTFKFDYLNIPVLANVYVVPGLALKAGIQPGFAVSRKLAIKSEPYSSTSSLNDGYKTFDLSIPVGVSYEYQNIILDARYNWGLTKVTTSVNDWKNSVFQVTLGYKFKL